MAVAKEAEVVIAKFDYKASDTQELHIHKGEKLTLIDDTQHWWKVMNSLGQIGYVPSNYVKRSKQGLFSSLRNTLGRRKSRADLTSPMTGASTGGRPPPLQPGFTSNGTVSCAIENVTKANTKSHDYVAPLLLSSSSGPSPVRNNTTVGYHPVVEAFSSNGVADPRSSLLTSSQQLPPVHLGLMDQSKQKSIALEAKNDNIAWNTINSTAAAVSWNPDTAPADQGGRHVDNQRGGGSISSRQICVARFAYTACQPDELTMQRGDRVCVLEKSSDGWWHGILLPPEGLTTVAPSHQQSSGWFPSNYVTVGPASAKSSVPGNAVQPNSLNSGSQALTSDPPPMLTSAMGTRSSALLDSSATSTTAPTRVSIPPSQTFTPQEPSTVLSPASYSAVPFPTSSAFSSLQSQSPLVPTSQPLQPQPTAFVEGIGGAMKDNFCYRETVLTLYPFTRNQVEELSFAAGEALEVLDKPADDPDWWRCRNVVGNVGLVPRNYIRVVKNLPSAFPPVQYPHRTSTTAMSGPTPQQVIVGGNDSGEEVRLAFAMSSPNAAEFARKPWYWGVIARSECEAVLNSLATSGEFIIRDSESHPGDLTITMNAGTKNRNFKVHVKNGEFYIGQKVFSSVDALINNYRSHPIYKSDQEKHFLTRPFQHPNCVAFLHKPFPSASSHQNPMLTRSR